MTCNYCKKLIPDDEGILTIYGWLCDECADDSNEQLGDLRLEP